MSSMNEIPSVYAIATRFVNVLIILSTGNKMNTHTKRPQIYTHHTQTWLPVKEDISHAVH